MFKEFSAELVQPKRMVPMCRLDEGLLHRRINSESFNLGSDQQPSPFMQAAMFFLLDLNENLCRLSNTNSYT